MTAVRRAYLELAGTTVELLGGRNIGDRWGERSALPELSVGALAAHLARAILQVEWYLEMPEPAPPASSAAQYYQSLDSTADLGSELNVGVRLRAEEAAAAGWARLFLDVRNVLERLTERLEHTPAERRLLVYGGRVLVVDEYLKTRLVEMTVHIDDLARSLEVPPPPLPEAATATAIAVMVDTARARHGDQAVLHALARRERDQAEALRVL